MIISFLLKPPVIAFQLFIAYIQYPLNLEIGQILPDRRLDLNDTKCFGMAEHLHILKTFEGIGQDIPLGLFVCITAFCKYAVGLLYY